MTEKIRVAIPVVVEGKYDKIKLSSVIEGTILTTGGFSVFNDAEKKQLLRKIARERGVILLTDSDGGGRQIRAYLRGILPPEKLYELYIPVIPGKEKRKKSPSKSGTLGVEGMEADLLRDLFRPFASDAPAREEVTAADLFADGLNGGTDSSARRAAFAEAAGLPPDLGAKAFLAAVNLLFGKAEYERILATLSGK